MTVPGGGDRQAESGKDNKRIDREMAVEQPIQRQTFEARLGGYPGPGHAHMVEHDIERCPATQAIQKIEVDTAARLPRSLGRVWLL